MMHKTNKKKRKENYISKAIMLFNKEIRLSNGLPKGAFLNIYHGILIKDVSVQLLHLQVNNFQRKENLLDKIMQRFLEVIIMRSDTLFFFQFPKTAKFSKRQQEI